MGLRTVVGEVGGSTLIYPACSLETHLSGQDKWDAGGEGQWFEDRLRFFNAGMIYFTYLTDFCYFSLKIVFRKLLDIVRAGKKMNHLKGDVEGFRYFH